MQVEKELSISKIKVNDCRLTGNNGALAAECHILSSVAADRRSRSCLYGKGQPLPPAAYPSMTPSDSNKVSKKSNATSDRCLASIPNTSLDILQQIWVL